jgi:hypothetical protein
VPRLEWEEKMRFIGLNALWLVAVMFVCAAGCGRSRPEMAYNDLVEGTVKLDDEPLAGVLVTFVPKPDPGAAAPTSSATTDGEGHFKLECDNSRRGAVVAIHHVLLSRGRPADPSHRGETEWPTDYSDNRPVPEVYKAIASTTLEMAVTAEKHSGYDFSIKSTDKMKR